MRPTADLNKACTLVATSAKSKVRCRRQPGKHMLVLSLTRFDPQPTWPLEIVDDALNPFFALTEMDRGMRG
jgi:hypothetical protein